MVVEVMGRHAGWIALHAGIAGGADVILLPEIPFHFDRVREKIEERYRRRSNFAIVVVSEGAKEIGADALYKLGKDEFRSTRCSAESQSAWPGRSRRRRGTKPGPSCWATSSAAARPSRSTVCSPNAWVAQPCATWRKTPHAEWSPRWAGRSFWFRSTRWWAEPEASNSTVTP